MWWETGLYWISAIHWDREAIDFLPSPVVMRSATAVPAPSRGFRDD